MRLSDARIKELQAILREIGLEYDDDQLQSVGLAVMRFVIARSQQKLNKGSRDGE